MPKEHLATLRTAPRAGVADSDDARHGNELYEQGSPRGEYVARSSDRANAGVVMRMKPDRRSTARIVSDRDVARRAYELYEQRGCEDGHDMDDWLQAERELRPWPRA